MVFENVTNFENAAIKHLNMFNRMIHLNYISIKVGEIDFTI